MAVIFCDLQRMTKGHDISFTCFLNYWSTCCDLLVQTGPGRSSSLVDPHSFTGAMVKYLQFTHALAVVAVFAVSCGLGAVCRIGNSPLISGCNQHCVSGSRHLHQLLQCQRSSEAAVEAGQLSVFTAEILWHNNYISCLLDDVFELCVFGTLRCGGCPLSGLSTPLLKPRRLRVSARLMLSQQPTGCAVAISYLPSLSTTLICLCMLPGLNLAPDQTQPTESCPSL